MAIDMNCKEFEKLIPDFFDKKMDFLTLNQFNKHMKNCPDCKEELTIRFLVIEGIQRLEEGDAFDLQRELKQHLDEAERKIRRHKHVLQIGEILEVLAILVVIGFALWVII